MRIIGFAGLAGAGKDAAAACVPGAWPMAFADPIYWMLSAMTGMSVDELKDRDAKEEPIEWLGRSPRFLLVTLGTEWGRDVVHPDLWVRIAARRLDTLESYGIETVVVSGVRFVNEVDLIHSRGGEVWRIDRLGTERMSGHRSEDGIPPVLIDRVIVNDGTLDDLRMKVRAALGAMPCRV
jgi:hypothetical protein